MALQKSISKFGFTASSAYHCINRCGYQKGLNSPVVPGDGNVYVEVNSYKNATARTDDAEPMEVRTFHFDLDTSSDAEGLLEQAYAHLKTLDEFDGATDV